MALPYEINVGTAPNNGTGDPLRTAFQKSNARDEYLEVNKQATNEKGAANGYAPLDANVKIGNEYIQMPVLPVETVPTTGEENVLYAESSTFRLKVWDGTQYNLYGDGSGTGGSITYQDVVDALGFIPEQSFSKNTAFNKDFGTTAGSVAQGNDSRIVNGQTAYEKRITGLSITGSSTKTVTITLADGTTVTGSFVDDGGSGGGTSDGNDYVSGGSFNSATGTATLTRTDGGTVQFTGFVTDAEKTTWNGKQDELLFDGEFYIDENGYLRNNISDYTHEEVWNTGESQVFTLPFEPTKFNGVNVFPGTRLHSSQYTFLPPNQVEILDTLTDGDIIEFDFQHFIIQP